MQQIRPLVRMFVQLLMKQAAHDTAVATRLAVFLRHAVRSLRSARSSSTWGTRRRGRRRSNRRGSTTGTGTRGDEGSNWGTWESILGTIIEDLGQMCE